MNRTVLILAGGLALVLAALIIRPGNPFSETAPSFGESPESVAGGAYTPLASTPSFARRAHRSDSPEFLPQLNQLSSLAQTHPAAALDALEHLLSNPLDDVSAWLAENPTEAASWIGSLPDGPVRNVVVERLLPEVASRNTQAAMNIAETLSEPELRDSAVSAVIGRWAAVAPLEALSGVAAREEWRETALLGRAFVAAATAHPEQIEQLFAIVPPESLDPSFLTRAAEALLAKDPHEAARWFATLENTPYRSVIAETMILHAGRNNPALAFIWATQLEPNRRLEALQGSLDRAVHRDPTAAPALLDCAWLSAQDRESLLVRLGKH